MHVNDVLVQELCKPIGTYASTNHKLPGILRFVCAARFSPEKVVPFQHAPVKQQRKQLQLSGWHRVLLFRVPHYPVCKLQCNVSQSWTHSCTLTGEVAVCVLAPISAHLHLCCEPPSRAMWFVIRVDLTAASFYKDKKDNKLESGPRLLH